MKDFTPYRATTMFACFRRAALKRLKPMLYRGMDRAQLDAAYDNLAAVTASAKLLADWAARSARFRERHRGHLGLAYGEQPRERLDRVLAGNPAAPTLADIHGGYWQMTFQTKEMYSALAQGAVSHGLNMAVVEYTLAPEARMDRIVGEVRHAISWLHEHLGVTVPIRGASTSPAILPAGI